MKYILILIAIFFISCVYLPYGSNVRTGIIKSINNDTLKFYGSKKKFILENKILLKVKDTIQYTVIKNSTNKSLPIIRKL